MHPSELFDRYKTAFDLAPLGMAMLDRHGVLFEANRAWCGIVGFAERVAAGLANPFLVSSGEVRIGASVGVALNESAMTTVEMLRRADAAQYRAKQAGGRRAELA